MEVTGSSSRKGGNENVDLSVALGHQFDPVPYTYTERGLCTLLHAHAHALTGTQTRYSTLWELAKEKRILPAIPHCSTPMRIILTSKHCPQWVGLRSIFFLKK